MIGTPRLRHALVRPPRLSKVVHPFRLNHTVHVRKISNGFLAHLTHDDGKQMHEMEVFHPQMPTDDEIQAHLHTLAGTAPADAHEAPGEDLPQIGKTLPANPRRSASAFLGFLG